MENLSWRYIANRRNSAILSSRIGEIGEIWKIVAILAISDENQQIFSGFSRLQKRPEVFYENIIVQSKVQRAITKITEESEDKIQKSQISKLFDNK